VRLLELKTKEETFVGIKKEETPQRTRSPRINQLPPSPTPPTRCRPDAHAAISRPSTRRRPPAANARREFPLPVHRTRPSPGRLAPDSITCRCLAPDSITCCRRQGSRHPRPAVSRRTPTPAAVIKGAAILMPSCSRLAPDSIACRRCQGDRHRQMPHLRW
jgi:hypothetical protein